MLCDTIYSTQYITIVYYAMLLYAILCCIILHYTIQHYAIVDLILQYAVTSPLGFLCALARLCRHAKGSCKGDLGPIRTSRLHPGALTL